MPDDRTALVVGASRGLGLGLAAELRSRGWRVVGTVRDSTAVRQVEAAGATVARADLRDPASIPRLEQQLAAETFDLVFVNAGIKGPEHQVAARATRDEIAELFLVNAVAPIAIAEAFLDRVRDGSGIVAFMSSDLGNIAGNTDGYIPLYRASKSALNSLIRSFIAGLGGRRITVLAVHPGWVRTDMGGAHAPLGVAESVRGIANALEARAGTFRHGFVDYRGRELAW